MDQLDLFGKPSGRVGPAAFPDATRALGDALPRNLYFGTSSWAFNGWSGIVYDRTVPDAVLATHGLPAYAAHPLLRSVGVDRTFYQTIDAETFRGWARVVPPTFRFLVKASEDTVLARFPRHARYGTRAGQENLRFLDAAWTTDAVVGPWSEGLGHNAGPLVFQLPPQDPSHLGGPERFATRLHGFLRALPRPPDHGFYAVEVRNPELLTPELAAALADVAAIPSLVVHPRMPDLRSQWAQFRVGTTGPVVVRWMLGHGLEYENAKANYAPFHRLCAPDPATRTTVARLASAMVKLDRPLWVIVNNKAEGSAPRSIEALAGEILEMGSTGA